MLSGRRLFSANQRFRAGSLKWPVCSKKPISATVHSGGSVCSEAAGSSGVCHVFSAMRTTAPAHASSKPWRARMAAADWWRALSAAAGRYCSKILCRQMPAAAPWGKRAMSSVSAPFRLPSAESSACANPFAFPSEGLPESGAAGVCSSASSAGSSASSCGMAAADWRASAVKLVWLTVR